MHRLGERLSRELGSGNETASPAVRRSVLALVALVAVSRSPHIAFRGRFWAEEGTSYFVHMAAANGPADLAWIYQRAGYAHAFANGATWIASLAPLRVAPLVTVWLSLGLLLVVVWIALTWPSDLLPTAAAKLTAAVLLVVGTSAVPEVWMNSLLTQTVLGIAALLILFVKVDELPTRAFVPGVALLAVAGLSGVYAAALAPLFVVVAVLDRSRRRWLNAGVLAATAGVQVAAVVALQRSGDSNAQRFDGGPGDLVVGVAGHVRDFLGRAVATVADTVPGGVPLVVLLAGLLLGALLWTAPDRRVAALLASAFVLIEVVVLFGSFGTGAGGRYAVVPIVILTFAAVHGMATAPTRSLRRAATALVAVVLVAGLAQFWSSEPMLIRCVDCPVWSDEVRRWEAGEIDVMRIWPYDRETDWVIRLPDGAR